MAHYTGAALYMTWGGTVLSGDQRTVGWDYSIDKVDTTAGADTDKSYVYTTRDCTIDMTLLDNGAGTPRNCLSLGGTGTLIIAPEGTATGKPKYSCPACLVTIGTEYPYDGEVELNLSFQKNGAWTANYEWMGSTY